MRRRRRRGLAAGELEAGELEAAKAPCAVIDGDRMYGELSLKQRSLFGDRWPKVQCGYEQGTSIFTYMLAGSDKRETLKISKAEKVPVKKIFDW